MDFGKHSWRRGWNYYHGLMSKQTVSFVMGRVGFTLGQSGQWTALSGICPFLVSGHPRLLEYSITFPGNEALCILK